MKPTHHLDDVTIVAYAAGTLGEAHSVVATAHLDYCDVCRNAVRFAESIGGELLADEEVKGVSDMCRSATMASLEAVPQARARAVSTPKGDLPLVVERALGGHTLDTLAWKKKVPGIATYEIPLTGSGRSHLMLLSIAPGKSLPEHGHSGEEMTLILRGSYTDHMGRFQAGDVADVDEDTEHRPIVDDNGPCICLFAIEAPTRFKSIWARLAQPFIGI